MIIKIIDILFFIKLKKNQYGMLLLKKVKIVGNDKKKVQIISNFIL